MNGQLLHARLSSEFPQSSPRLNEFPSGSFMIDLDVRGEPYVIEYVVGEGYGLSKQKRATFGWEEVDESFETGEDLERKLRKQMMAPC